MTPLPAGCSRTVSYLVPCRLLSVWTTTYRNVYQLDPEGVPNQVIRQDRSALETRVRPSMMIRVSDVKPCHGHCKNLVGRLRNRSLHSFLVRIAED